MITKPLVTSVSVLALTSSLAAPGAVAQGGADDQLIEEVITIGTRIQGRSALDSMAPIDVVSGEDFVNQGDTDLNNLLRNLVPSYNINTQPISDAATIVRPANLRGLPPDSTLVLVNGKRRHRAAVISFLGGGLSDGAQGPDISAIPSIALEQVEVLRDGAAAQYGSDAIAGVMNLKLKDAAEGGTLEGKRGSTYEGDGDTWQIAGNIGLPFTSSGFANFSFEYREADPTNRSVQRDDAAGLIAGDRHTAVPVPEVADPAQIWGQPEIEEDLKLVANLGLELRTGKEFYAFGNYSARTVDGGFFYRNPDTRAGVYGVPLNHVDSNGNTVIVKNSAGEDVSIPLLYDADGNDIPREAMLDSNGVLLDNASDLGTQRHVRLVADVTGNMSGNCSQYATNETSQGGVDIRDAEGLAQLKADPDCFVFNEMFPGGFTPRFGGDLNDIAGVVGVRGSLDNGMTYDVSIGAGRNEVDYFIYNTVNASLGPDSPTRFEPGTYIQLEKNFNIDLGYPVDIGGLASPLHIAGGFEWREEQFEARVGDPASFEAGLYTAQGFTIGSNGFSGFSEDVAGSWDRRNIAFYTDLEAEVTNSLLLGLAVRWEDFSDFGTTTNGKLSARWALTDNVSIRSTLSTGFRAPTPGQSNVSNISTVFENDELINRGTIPPTNPIAVYKGGKPLEPETSENFSLGLVFSVGPLGVTIDYFDIDVSDRITQSASIELTQAEADELEAMGIAGASDLAAFRFYTNDFDTNTRGVDLVATYPFGMFGGDTNLNLAFNWTKTEVVDFNPEVVDDTRIRQLEENLPEYRGNVSLVHHAGPWRGLLRVNYFGEFYEAHLDDGSLPIEAGDEWTVDMEIGYSFYERYTLVLGAENLLDEYPDKNPWAGVAGAEYPVTSPMGFNGGFYYARLRYDF